MKTSYKFLSLCLVILWCTVWQASVAYSQTMAAGPAANDTTDFTITQLINQPASKVYTAINNVRGWWSEEIEGNTAGLNDVFKYHFEDVHRCELQVVELAPDKKVVWLVKNNYFKFTKDKSEWTGTTIIFELEEKDGKTQLRFTHKGLVPEYECYNACSSGWNQYIGKSLPQLVTTGKGQPNAAGKPKTINEQQLRSAAGIQ